MEKKPDNIFYEIDDEVSNIFDENILSNLDQSYM